MEILIGLTVFVYGICIGSFLNVCIYRLPLKLSVVSPPSACPSCGKPVKFYDNIPVISYMLLLGRCRYCRNRISPAYAAIEILTGVMAVATWMHFGLTISALVYFVFIASLTVITFIDLKHRIIPNIVTLPGIPIAIVAGSFLIPGMTFLDAFLGAAAGGGSLYAVAAAYSFFTGNEEGMGFGDIKLLAMIGGLIGMEGVILTVMLSSISGTIAGICIMLYTRKKDFRLAIPFGPFLSFGAVIYVFFGKKIVEWYFATML